MKDGLPLVGTGDLGSRVWSGPAITIIGMDIPSVADSLNAVNAYAHAKINTRVHPGRTPTRRRLRLSVTSRRSSRSGSG